MLVFIVLSVTVHTVGYFCLFRGDQIFMDFVRFLSMIIYEALYTWCLRYNICSAWFLDIRISICFGSHSFPSWSDICEYVYVYVCIYVCIYMYYYIGVYIVSKCCAAAWKQSCTSVSMSPSITRVTQLRSNKAAQVLVSQ